jgi:hypothetical protein
LEPMSPVVIDKSQCVIAETHGKGSSYAFAYYQ